jgi:hypothetical protein
MGRTSCSASPFFAHRHLDHDVWGERREVAALAEPALDILSDDLGAHGTRRDLTDLSEDLVIAAADLGKQGGVGRHAVKHAPAGGGADLIDLGSVQEDLYGRSNLSMGSQR